MPRNKRYEVKDNPNPQEPAAKVHHYSKHGSICVLALKKYNQRKISLSARKEFETVPLGGASLDKSYSQQRRQCKELFT